MAIKSLLRLNQMKEGLGLLDGTLASDLSASPATTYSISSEGQNTMEATLQNIARSLHRRFGSVSAGSFNNAIGGANTVGTIASFSASDVADVIIQNASASTGIQVLAADAQVANRAGNAGERAAIDIQASAGGFMVEGASSSEMNVLDGTLDILALGTDAGDVMTIQGAAAARTAVLIDSPTSAGGIELQAADADSVININNATGDHYIKLTSNSTAANEKIEILATSGTDSTALGMNAGTTAAFHVKTNAGGVLMEVADEKALMLQNDAGDLFMKLDSSATAEDERAWMVNTNGDADYDHTDAAAIQIGAMAGGIQLAAGKSLQAQAQGILLDASEGSTAVTSKPANYGGASSMSGLSLAASSHVWFQDAHGADQTNSGWSESKGIPLSVYTGEWEDFESTFGEVSLLNALVQAGTGGTTDAGIHQFVIDTGQSLTAGDFLIDSAAASDSGLFSVAEFHAASSDAVVDLTAALNSKSQFDCDGIDQNEITHALKVFVNGQLLMGRVAASVGANHDYAIVDEDPATVAAYGGDFAFSIMFGFDLEEGDVVQIQLG